MTSGYSGLLFVVSSSHCCPYPALVHCPRSAIPSNVLPVTLPHLASSTRLCSTRQPRHAIQIDALLTFVTLLFLDVVYPLPGLPCSPCLALDTTPLVVPRVLCQSSRFGTMRIIRKVCHALIPSPSFTHEQDANTGPLEGQLGL